MKHTLERLQSILDDSQHPDTAPVLVAVLVLLLVLMLTWILSRGIRRAWSDHRRQRHSQRHGTAVAAYHQKLHEGERW